MSEHAGKFSSEVGKANNYFNRDYIESIFLENQTFGAFSSYNIPDGASVLLALADYQGSAGTNLTVNYKIIGNEINLDIIHKTDLIAAAVMNQPFYLITASPKCNINIISEQHSNLGRLGLGLVEGTPIKE